MRDEDISDEDISDEDISEVSAHDAHGRVAAADEPLAAWSYGLKFKPLRRTSTRYQAG